MSRVLEPEEILADLRRLDPGLGRERDYGERALFHCPAGSAAPRPLLAESLGLAREKWKRRGA